MKRYEVNLDSSECYQGMIESPDGEWVEYDSLNIAAMKEIKVKIKSVYGSDKMYPACPDSQMFCDIAGTKILTESLQNILVKRGWKITPIL